MRTQEREKLMIKSDNKKLSSLSSCVLTNGNIRAFTNLSSEKTSGYYKTSDNKKYCKGG